MRNRKLFSLPFWLVVLVCLCLVLVVYLRPKLEQASGRVLEVDLRSRSGDRIVVRGVQPASIVVHFWANWCEPCKSEFPAFLKAADAFPKNWRVLAISLDPNWDENRDFLMNVKLPARVEMLLDPDFSVANRFGSFQYPETYLLDSQLKIRSKWVGPQPWDSLEFLKSMIQVEGKS